MPRFSLSTIFAGRTWPVILIGSTVLVFVIGIATVRESYSSWKVDREILALSAQADALEGRNAKLRELAQALQQPERVEVEARTRLGMREPGEHVVVLNGLEATSSWQGSLAMDVVEDKPLVEKSNPELWFDYFFKPSAL